MLPPFFLVNLIPPTSPCAGSPQTLVVLHLIKIALNIGSPDLTIPNSVADSIISVKSAEEDSLLKAWGQHSSNQ